MGYDRRMHPAHGDDRLDRGWHLSQHVAKCHQLDLLKHQELKATTSGLTNLLCPRYHTT